MEHTNRKIVDQLISEHVIRVEQSPLLDQAPPPLPTDFAFSRIEGMLLGLAIGDALGNTSEGRTPSQRGSRYGEIRGYLPNRYAQGRAVGLPSDDTQLAFWTLEQLLEDGGLIPESLAARFASRRIFGIGRTVREFLASYHAGQPWQECGVASAGNGALMRIAPILIPHLRRPTPDLWADTTLCAMITHNDAGSIACCLAFVGILWELLRMDGPPEPDWWIRSYLGLASGVERDTNYRPRSERCEPYAGPIWGFIERELPAAHRAGLSVVEACDRWYSGAYLLETMPGVLYILMQHGHDPEEAIVRAVNDTKDNDTYAAIVGAAVGGLHGREALPERWIEDLLGRTGAGDDGRVFELIEQAARQWGSG